MSACKEITTIGNVQDELTRLRELVRIVYASATSNDRDFSEIKEGLLWLIGDIEDDVTRVIDGIQKIKEARS
jgi:hypothetical protein